MESEPLSNKSRTWGTVCHLIALVGFVGVPFGHLLGPLVLWLVMRKEDAFVDVNGKESLNFQISMTLYCMIAAVLIVIMVGVGLLFLLALVDVVFVILAAVKVSRGETYRYPITIRLIR